MSFAKKPLVELAQMVNDRRSPERHQQPAAQIAAPKQPSLPTWCAIDPADARRPAQPPSRFAIKTGRGVRWLN